LAAAATSCSVLAATAASPSARSRRRRPTTQSCLTAAADSRQLRARQPPTLLRAGRRHPAPCSRDGGLPRCSCLAPTFVSSAAPCCSTAAANSPLLRARSSVEAAAASPASPCPRSGGLTVFLSWVRSCVFFGSK
jgi:hypothetical protein